jgi:hypothetical protein
MFDFRLFVWSRAAGRIALYVIGLERVMGGWVNVDDLPANGWGSGVFATPFCQVRGRF